VKRILWFRRDLRTIDNPLVSFSGEVMPIFIFDSNILCSLERCDKRVSLIFFLVEDLKKQLQEIGLELKLFYGKPKEIFTYLQGKYSFDEVVASGDYDFYARQRDKEVSHILPFKYMNDTYIFKPDEVLKKDKTPYHIFTPFYNQAKKQYSLSHTKEITLTNQKLFSISYEGLTHIKDGKTKNAIYDINYLGFDKQKLTMSDAHYDFSRLKKIVPRYLDNRDYPTKDATSHLSIALRFGTISIRSVLRFLEQRKSLGEDTGPFFRQLVFRDFYAYLLYHYPHIENENYKYSFKGVENSSLYEKFCTASTGVPIVDAGIKELLQTGYMHNRVRMICASFFTKHLLLPWQWGESFFAKYLLDYDKASNVLSWQWSSGTGIDPQPYFRIFNPYTQSKKFDSDALYIKKWLPMLEHIDAKNLHDESFLLNNAIANYPKPIVIHKQARQEALNFFSKVL
jgi:deoxyribodipyrimidine photo-lyase